MRFRLIAFLPIATLITVGLLASASSIVFAIERSWSPPVADLPPLVHVRQFETECDALFREIHALSHATTRCGENPVCFGSPLLCPAAMDEEIERDFQRLRKALNERCGLPLRLMDYAWSEERRSEAAPQSPTDGGSASRRSRLLPDDGPDGGDGNDNHDGHGDGHGKGDAVCAGSHDWLEAATSGRLEATRFLF